MTITLPEKSSHWYTRLGEPCHKVPKKDGSGLRDVNLRWDRHLSLLPSVTNVMSVKAKPAITDYMITQALMAAVTLPRTEGETADAFMERVIVDMDQHRKKASEFGSAIHNYSEVYPGDKSLDPDLEPYASDHKRWLDENVSEFLWTEKTLVNEKIGYAGTADRYVRLKDGRSALLDLKTQQIKERATKTKGPVKNDPAFYPEFEYQLVAYGRCLDEEPDAYISVVIDSLAPGPCHVYEWPLGGRRNAWRAFLACHFLWSLDRNYWSSTYWK